MVRLIFNLNFPDSDMLILLSLDSLIALTSLGCDDYTIFYA